MKREMKGNILLLITALIWGSAFVAQSAGAESVGPFTFLALRSYLGGLALLPVIAVLDRLDGGLKREKSSTPEGRKKLVLTGILCGIVLCIASVLQQHAMATSEAGKAGFITALYILIVPILGLFFKNRVPLKIWACIAVALVGLYLLSVSGSFSFAPQDIELILCAIIFSVHITIVDRMAQDLDGVRLSCIQFFVAAVLSTIFMPFEAPSVENILSAALPILYAGLCSSGIGYTLQIVGQQYTKPAVASLIMSLESVFALLAGILLLSEMPTLREGIGCALMFGAIIVCQLPSKEKR